MAFASHAELAVDRSNPHFTARAIVGGEVGATSLTVRDVLVEPGGSVPMHIHPDCEEAMLVLEGSVEATVGDETRTMGPGLTAVAPPGVRHQMVNKSDGPVRLLGIFPTANPTRRYV